MASKRRLRRKACDGKIRYDNQDHAIRGIRILAMKGKNKYYLRPYRCHFCNKFHIGGANRFKFVDKMPKLEVTI